MLSSKRAISILNGPRVQVPKIGFSFVKHPYIYIYIYTHTHTHTHTYTHTHTHTLDSSSSCNEEKLLIKLKFSTIYIKHVIKMLKVIPFQQATLF